MLRRPYSEEATKPSSLVFVWCYLCNTQVSLRFTKLRFEAIGTLAFAIQLLFEDSLCDPGRRWTIPLGNSSGSSPAVSGSRCSAYSLGGCPGSSSPTTSRFTRSSSVRGPLPVCILPQLPQRKASRRLI